ncbi:nitronate monooxygenase family protein [Parvibaculum sp.]|uniref:NAD(P)H-dependent flavin oxidoreductase n=1 Tax=Parvibaculum sp. TaxID=2024848 RepID=UPI00272F943E|nr:nitronate monooxygenase family protein [Parvibaculum sp.]MDP2151720.1 nitronate monooxygenase family protein [Parvibaculum sp.]MDP3328303.1 nitronate monooxygenase family protein [Parvibaculum sp.]
MDKTAALTGLLGIDLPILLAPMAGASTPELAAAVSNAGGLGALGTAMMKLEQVRQETATLRQLTNQSFNLNFFVHDEPKLGGYDAGPMQQALAPFYSELGLGGVPAPSVPAPAFNEEMLALLLELRPRVASFHFGLPAPETVERLKEAGMAVIGSATTAAEARALESGGADAIIAQGHEAGGHRGTFLDHVDLGTVGTIALVPQVVDAVDVPVIAAGGIGDARGIAAAFMLGAAGVQLGTAYLACPEANVHPVHRKALAEASDHSTVVTKLFSGRPARAIRNRLTEDLHAHERHAAPFPAQRPMVAQLTTASAKANRAELMQLWSGQAARLSKAEPAAEKTVRLMKEAYRLMGR